MSAIERRLRHRAELRAAILDAALEIVATDGMRGLSIRAIADRIHYSAATIYLYFESKEALVREVAREGFRRLLAALQAATRGNAPADALPAAARAYIDFALEHAAYFRAMFEPSVDAEPNGGAPRTHSHPDDCGYRGVLAEVERAAGNSVLGSAAHTSAMATLATVHGLVSLYLSGRIDDLAHDPGELLALVERCIAAPDPAGTRATAPAGRTGRTAPAPAAGRHLAAAQGAGSRAGA